MPEPGVTAADGRFEPHARPTGLASRKDESPILALAYLVRGRRPIPYPPESMTDAGSGLAEQPSGLGLRFRVKIPA